MVKRRFFIEKIYAPVLAFFVPSILLAIGVSERCFGSFETVFLVKNTGTFNESGQGRAKDQLQETGPELWPPESE